MPPGFFSRERLLLKLDTHGYSPAVLHQIVGAAGQVKSQELAAQVLDLVGDISISGRHVNRLAEAIGVELQAQRDRETEDYVHHRRPEPTAPAPPVVAIGLDGGRVLTRATGQGVGVHGQQWQEDKVACLLWQQYVTWMTFCWQGRVRAVIEDLEVRLERLGP